MKGKIYLVGAGPGDPDLLTVKALRVLSQADVVLHDELISQKVLRLVQRSAYVRNVGKRCGQKSITQEQIHSLMVMYATANLTVVRLKAGDPLVFGRAGEEMEALRRANVQFEVVPGITAALAAAASAGIPLTDRKLASKIVFLTNHFCAGKTLLDREDFISSDTTAVVYMPGTDYGSLAKRMLAADFEPRTPCMLVSHAALAQQKIHRTVLAELANAPPLPAPVLLIIGAVAGIDSCEENHASDPESESLVTRLLGN